jgi:hypothetical protein
MITVICLVQPPTARSLRQDDQTGNDGRDGGVTSGTVLVPEQA